MMETYVTGYYSRTDYLEYKANVRKPLGAIKVWQPFRISRRQT